MLHSDSDIFLCRSENISYPPFYAQNTGALTGEVLSEAVGRRPKALLLNLKNKILKIIAASPAKKGGEEQEN